MRKDIFGLGLAQLCVTAVLFGGRGWARPGLTAQGAVVGRPRAGLSATAIALQMLGERNDMQAPYGQRSFAILLFQDISIVPILAPSALLRTGVSAEGSPRRDSIVVGQGAGRPRRCRPDRPLRPEPVVPFANSGAREVMTASALLVVLGAAPDAGSRPLDGDGRVPRRRPPRRIELPPPARGRYRAVPRHPPRPSSCRSACRSISRSCASNGCCSCRRPAVILGKTASIAVLMRLFGSPWRDGLRGGAILATAGELRSSSSVRQGLGLLPSAPGSSSPRSPH